MSRKRPKRQQKTLDFWAQLQQLIDDAGGQATARQVYYMAVTRGLVPKTDRGATRVTEALGEAREDGVISWDAVVDHTRSTRIRPMHERVEDAMLDGARSFRSDLWADQERRAVVWCESDSVAAFIQPITDWLRVPLNPARGQSSKSFVWEVTQALLECKQPIAVLYVGDHDATGLVIERSIRERMERYSDDALDMTWERVAVTPAQIKEYGLPASPAKMKDANLAAFRAHCEREGLPVVATETEAIKPQALRFFVERAIIGLMSDLDAFNRGLKWDHAERVRGAAVLDATGDPRYEMEGAVRSEMHWAGAYEQLEALDADPRGFWPHGRED